VLTGYGMEDLDISKKIEIKAFSKDWQRLSFLFKTRNINIQRNKPIGEHLYLDFPPITGGHSITTDTDAGLYEKYHESSQFDIPYIKRNFIQPTKNIVISGILQTLDFSFYFDDPYPTSQTFYDIPAG